MHLCLFVSETLTPNVTLWKPQQTMWFGQPNCVLHTAVPAGLVGLYCSNYSVITDFTVFTEFPWKQNSKDTKVSKAVSMFEITEVHFFSKIGATTYRDSSVEHTIGMSKPHGFLWFSKSDIGCECLRHKQAQVHWMQSQTMGIWCRFSGLTGVRVRVLVTFVTLLQ